MRTEPETIVCDLDIDGNQLEITFDGEEVLFRISGAYIRLNSSAASASVMFSKKLAISIATRILDALK